jgi:hypothetical protein
MIPVSLLLILVAVTLLVFGLSGGSSNLLISSIVASLLAAVALVIGARQTAAKRVAEEPAGFGPAPQQTYPAEAESVYATDADPGYPAETDPTYAAEAEPIYAAEPAFAEATARDTVQFEPATERVEGDLSADEAPVATAAPEAAPAGSGGRRADAEPDYDRATETINAARSESPGADAWRRAPAEPDDIEDDEFDEPDADDPEDEPLPQAVRPADAVRVARMDAEVLVVDGRPRYHLADCPHLVGKLAEPVPVNEAIELGFTPCGLCRPVDRLAATAAHS